MRKFRWAAALSAVLATGVLAAPTVAAGPGCTELQGTVDAEGVCRVHAETDTYTLDFSFPDDYPDQAPLVAYLTQARDGFVNVADNPDALNLPYELDARGEGYQSATTRSVVFTVWQNVGGVHPQTFYQAFNWDVAKKAPITFDTLFKPGTEPMDVIYREVNRYLERQGMIVPVSPAEGMDPARYQNFALTDDSLLFFFSQGELFAESAGPVQAVVPRSAVESLLAV
ncbi:esterase [Mycolicibacterium phlei]